jgi:hypothetical protein
VPRIDEGEGVFIFKKLILNVVLVYIDVKRCLYLINWVFIHNKRNIHI